MARKLEAAGSSAAGPMGGLGGGGRLGKFILPADMKKEESKLEQIARDGAGVGIDLMRGLSTHIIKNLLFNRTPCGCGTSGSAGGGGENGLGKNLNLSKQGEVPMES